MVGPVLAPPCDDLVSVLAVQEGNSPLAEASGSCQSRPVTCPPLSSAETFGADTRSSLPAGVVLSSSATRSKVSPAAYLRSTSVS